MTVACALGASSCAASPTGPFSATPTSAAAVHLGHPPLVTEVERDTELPEDVAPAASESTDLEFTLEEASATPDVATTTPAPEPIPGGGWMTRIAVPSGARAPEPTAVAVGDDGSVVIAASFADHVEVGTRRFQATGHTDALLAKVDSSGQLLWAKAFGGVGADGVLAVEARGDTLAVAGIWSGDVEFGGQTRRGGSRYFIASLDPATGEPRWVAEPRRASEESWSQVNDLAITSTGDIVVVGSYRGAMHLTSQVSFEVPGWGGFVARYVGGSGGLRWARTVDSRDASLLAVALTATDEVLVAGSFSGRADIGTGRVRSHGAQDILLGRFDRAGEPRWLTHLGSQMQDSPHRLLVLRDDTVVVSAIRTRTHRRRTDQPPDGAFVYGVAGGNGAMMWHERLSRDSAPVGGPDLALGADGTIWASWSEPPRRDGRQLSLAGLGPDGERRPMYAYSFQGERVDGPTLAAIDRGGHAVFFGSLFGRGIDGRRIHGGAYVLRAAIGEPFPARGVSAAELSRHHRR